jgi:hypothetical protein
MEMDFIDTARTLALTVYGGITFPGEYILLHLAAWLPGLAPHARGIVAGSFDPMPLLLSLLFWLLLAAAALRVMRWLRQLAVMFGNAFVAAALRIRLTKTRIKASITGMFGTHRDTAGVATGMIEFDPIDITVLRIANAQAAGFSVAAPDLVVHMKCRPAIVEESLERLTAYRLLAPTSGASEGYDCYKLTSAGATFINSIE